MAVNFPTPLADLNAVLTDLVSGTQSILGVNFCGAYLQGSFAIGDWDEYSDVDFIVVVEQDVSAEEFAGLRELHHRIYDQPCPWAQHLEGSYFPKDLLRREDPALTPLIYIDNAHRELERTAHDNSLVVRWTLREHGITLAGLEPRSLVEPVPVDDLRREVRAVMRQWSEEILTGRYTINNCWAQPFAVISYCRMLQTLQTGTVESKPAGVRWGLQNLDPQWADLIRRAWAERPEPGIKVRQAADWENVRRTEEFVRYVLALIR